MASLKKTMQLGLKTAKIKLISYLPRFFLSLGVIFVSYILAQLTFNHITRVDLDKKTVQNGKIVFKTLGDICFFSIIGFGIILVLVNLGVELSTLFVVLGSVGLAIALALQDTISNISSGIMILLLNYYDIGDLIEVGDKMGYVDQFDLFTTSLKNMDGILIKLPNNLITKGVLMNYHKSEDILVAVNVTISNNEKQINYDDLFNKIKDELKNKMNFITDKENIKTSISDISSTGTKLIIKVPVKSENFVQARSLSTKIVRDVIVSNNLLLLDNNYIKTEDSRPASSLNSPSNSPSNSPQ
jgi:small conductance mechanosensitive channel